MRGQKRETYIARKRDIEGLLELNGCPVVFSEQPRAYASVVNGDKLVVFIGLLSVLSVILVT